MSLMRTLYGRISLTFLLLLVVIGGLQVFISVKSSVNYVCEASQKLNFSLAAGLASACAEFLQDSIDYKAIDEAMAHLQMINPGVNAYMLDQSGKIIAHFSEEDDLEKQHIDLTPINKFLADDGYDKLPIFGDDPLSLNRKKVFSVAPIYFGFNQSMGYLYIILVSARDELAGDGISGSYVLRTSALLLLTTLLFGAASGLFLFFFLTKRLHEMTGVVKKFEEGQYAQRVPVATEDEVGQLGIAFNHMAETIQNIMHDLEKSDRLRRELVANISHDLRSPLASIQGYIETVLMKDEKLSAQERQTYLETILKNVNNLNQLVQQLFELSRLDARELEPLLEPFSIAELTQDVALKFQPQAEEKKLRLKTHFPMDLPLVYGDIGMIERVLSNLIENALQYTQSQGEVVLELLADGDEIKVIVSDSGIGISPDDLTHIFDRFYRVEKSRPRSSGGSGLGLAIAKKILEAHGSSLNVESKINVGSSFSFTLQIFKNGVAVS
jgi:signal transduction histidine kinase